jgi:hypothetical protein
MPSPRTSPALVLAVLLFLGTAVAGLRDMGWVGEVTSSWALPRPPGVLVGVNPPVWSDPSRTPHAGHRIGQSVALEASQVRPTEVLALGDVRLPLAVNRYTGGLPDWPSRALRAATGWVGAAQGLHVLYGVGLVFLCWRVLRLHGAVVGAGAASLWLATDFHFVFYRKVLGGTEVWLLAATLLLARGLWDRRWRGGGMAVWAMALALGMGLHAKLTFAGFLVGAAGATLLTRWDRGPLGAPAPVPARHRWLAAGLVAALLLPLGIAAWHGGLLPDEPRLRSHDDPALQLHRVLDGLAHFGSAGSPAREQPANLVSFLVQPLSFFVRACGADAVPTIALGRAWGLLLVAAGTALAWRDRRDASQTGALLRWLSIAVPASGLALFLLNRDLHHLAMLTAVLAMWAGLCVDRVAALVSPPRSPARGRAALVLLLPWMSSGIAAALGADALLSTCDAPVISRTGQQAVVDLVRGAPVQRLVVASYDLYGVLEVLAPEVRVDNGWGALSSSSDRRATLVTLLRHAEGGHYLTVRPTAPTIYQMDPSEDDLAGIARDAQVRLAPVGTLEDAAGAWARLYAVTPTP